MTSTIEVEDNSGITGFVEIRPSLFVPTEEWYTENTASLGYLFKDNIQIDYTQYFNTSLYAPEASNEFAFSLETSFVRLRLDNLWESDRLSFDFHPRIELPTNEFFLDTGRLLGLRNDFFLNYQWTPQFKVTLREVPILLLNTETGYWIDDESAAANPIFQNRVYLEANWQITEALGLYFPFIYQTTRFGRFDVDPEFEVQVGLNEQWVYELYIWPELTYALSPNFYIGLSYMSGNFLADGSLDLEMAFNNGVGQFMFGAIL